MIPTHCFCGRSIVSLFGAVELHGCPVDEPGHFFAQVERAAISSIPPTLPITATDTCYNGGVKDGCGERIEFNDGEALCPKCGVYQRYVAADDEFIQFVLGDKAKIISIGAGVG